ncbi:hypothetical protein ACGF07_04080 [Kitasatospora sp. NPDC048194]
MALGVLTATGAVLPGQAASGSSSRLLLLVFLPGWTGQAGRTRRTGRTA